ncbi:hypothetical protein NEUTE2DRAFT_73936 [Neurospora tetrasperma FGSC 2509]|nr:hypothetical protein NEUTE2DRAFT_73936 [Neurospora tetrasperma FGSC 2509]
MPTDRPTNRLTGWLCLLCFAVQVLYAATSRFSTTLLRQHAIENPQPVHFSHGIFIAGHNVEWGFALPVLEQSILRRDVDDHLHAKDKHGGSFDGRRRYAGLQRTFGSGRLLQSDSTVAPCAKGIGCPKTLLPLGNHGRVKKDTQQEAARASWRMRRERGENLVKPQTCLVQSLGNFFGDGPREMVTQAEGRLCTTLVGTWDALGATGGHPDPTLNLPLPKTPKVPHSASSRWCRGHCQQERAEEQGSLRNEGVIGRVRAQQSVSFTIHGFNLFLASSAVSLLETLPHLHTQKVKFMITTQQNISTPSISGPLIDVFMLDIHDREISAMFTPGMLQFRAKRKASPVTVGYGQGYLSDFIPLRGAKGQTLERASLMRGSLALLNHHVPCCMMPARRLVALESHHQSQLAL